MFLLRRWIAALLLAWPRPIAAQEASRAAQARALIVQGVELRKQGDDRNALRAFDRAFELDPSPAATAQRALAEQALGHWLDAAQHLEQALAHTSEPWLLDHRAALEAARGEIASRLGTLEVTCNVAGAEVRVDGRLLGRTPLTAPLPMVVGQSVIQVSAPGHLDITRRVEVDAQRLSRLDVTLIASQPPEATPANVAPLPAQRAQAALSTAQGANDGASTRDVLLYTSAGLAALGAAVGVTGYVLREVNVRLYNDDARCNVRLGVRRADECPDEAAAWRRGEVLAIVGLSTAGVFGAAALYLLLGRTRAPGHHAAACAIGPGSLVCRGRF